MLAGLMPAGAEPIPPPRRVGRRHHSTAYGGGHTRTTLHATNGKRECERRQRQIAKGSLRVENGLDAFTT